MIRLNVFADAFSKVPLEQTDHDWPDLCDTLEALLATTAATKVELPAVTFGTLREPYNVNANYLDHTALAIDVDRVDLHALITIAEARQLSAFIYGSPSDNADGDPAARRVRVIVELTEPIPAIGVKHCRLALAELLGIGPGQGVETALAVSQIMFAGTLDGTPDRECFRLEGEALDTVALLELPLREQWAKPKAPGTATPRERVAVADPDERTAALLEAVAEHWDAPGSITGRRQILRALGGYLAKRGWSDEQIAAVARGLETERPEAIRVSLMIECARQARLEPDSAAGWSTLVGWNPDAAAVIESIAKDPREPDGFQGVWVPAFAKMFERIGRAPEPETDAPDDAEPFAPAAAADGTPIFLCSRKSSMVLIWEGDELGHRPIHEKRVRLRVRELSYNHGLVQLYAKGGKPLSTEAILETNGASYVHTAYAFRNRVTAYDPTGEGKVTIGYPLETLGGQFDADADAWLRALGGAHYDRLAVWIASCSQENINRLSACLIVMGRADSGKSMLGHALARMWNQTPPALALVAVQFNADLLRCPILVDEEAQLFGSKQLSTKRFRDVIQSVGRSVEFKGLERCELTGALRAIVSCNGYSDLHFADLGGPAVIEALRDRMLVIDATGRADACREPLARLRLPNDHRVDLDRVARHMAWLCETIELPAERFLGAGGDESEGAILGGHVNETVDLWETLRDWLDADTGTGGIWSVSTKHGLCVDPKAAAASLERAGRGWDLARIRAALAPFRTGDYRPEDAPRPRLWVVDSTRIADALQLDADAVRTLRTRLEAQPPVPPAPEAPRAKTGRFKAKLR
jgi:hypothetical protein